jgi:hypothetical protein
MTHALDTSGFSSSNGDVMDKIKSAWNTGVKECRIFFNIGNKQTCERQTLCDALDKGIDGKKMPKDDYGDIALKFKGYAEISEGNEDLTTYKHKNRFNHLKEIKCE